MSYNRQSWPQNIVLQSQGDDVAYIVTSNTYAAGSLPINGAGAGNDGNYVNGLPAFVTWTCDGDERNNTLTITGKDQANRTYVITTAGVNASIITIEVPYQSILDGGLILKNASASTMSVGISSTTSTPWIPFFEGATPLNSGVNVTLSNSAVLQYTIEYTQDYIFGPVVPTNIQPDLTLKNSVASGTTPIPYATNAVRMRFDAYTSGNARMQVPMTGANAFKNF